MFPSIHFHIGLRTVKTAAAVILSLLIVGAFGTSDAKMVFAMLGAMAAVQPTFKDSVTSSLTQIVGVLFGALVGVLLLMLPIPPLVVAGIGVVLVITLYNTFGIRFAPGLPCLIIVILCFTPGIRPVQYAVGRVWDTAIGLAVGMVINTLVFPYDNSRRIRETIRSLDRELLALLENLFDGDSQIPDTASMGKKVDEMRSQLKLFENQKLILRRRGQNRDIADFRVCERKARELAARMEVLCHIDRPGILSAENRERLQEAGAVIRDTRRLDHPTELDVVTNYHIKQILSIRQQLLNVLG